MAKIRDTDRFPRRMDGESVRADVKRTDTDWKMRFGSEKYPCGSKNATNAESSAVCLITMPPREPSRIIALPEYFRSDTPGLARSCDMYPNRLSL